MSIGFTTKSILWSLHST